MLLPEIAGRGLRRESADPEGAAPDCPQGGSSRRAATVDSRTRGGGETAAPQSARLPAPEGRRPAREREGSAQPRLGADGDLPQLDLAPGVNGIAVATAGDPGAPLVDLQGTQGLASSRALQASPQLDRSPPLRHQGQVARPRPPPFKQPPMMTAVGTGSERRSDAMTRGASDALASRGDRVARRHTSGGRQDADFSSSFVTATRSMSIAVCATSSESAPLDVSDTDTIRELLRKALVDHCGSLDNAFRWLDFTHRRALGAFQWDSGLRVLNLQGPLRGIKTRKLHQVIAVKHKGSVAITMKAWRAFFDYEKGNENKAGADGQLKAAKVVKKVKGMRARVEDPRELSDDLEACRSSDMPDLDGVLDLAADDGVRASGSSPKQRHLSRQLVPSDRDKAEAMQLQEDMKRMDFQGVKALAYIFTVKLGSLEKAFRWLEGVGRSGHFSNVQFATGEVVLHIDMEKLTGFSARDVFMMMGGQSGQVTKQKWFEFFNGMSEDDKAAIKDASGAFRRNTMGRLKQAWTDELETDEPPVAASKSQGSPAKPRQPRPSGQRPQQQGRLRTPAAPAEQRTSSKDSRASQRTPSRTVKSPDVMEARVSSKASTRAATSGRARSASDAGLGDRAASPPVRHLATQPESARGPTSRKPSPRTSQADRQESPVKKKDTEREPADKPQIALEEFCNRVRQELGQLRPDQGVVYDRLKRNERMALEEIARELGLWSGAQPGGGILVFREGPVAEDVRKALKELGPGEFRRFQALEWAPRRFCRGLAEQASFWVSPPEAADVGGAASALSSGGPLEVFNTKGSIEDFSSGVRKALLRLAPGETVDFPPILSKEQAEAVKSVAKELTYLFDSFTGPQGIYVSVGHLAGFKARVREELDGLRPPDSVRYGPGPVEATARGGDCAMLSLHGPGLPALVRSVLRQVVDETPADLEASESVEGARWTVIAFLRRAPLEADDAGDVEIQSLPVVAPTGTLSDEAIKEKCTRIFGIYATGNSLKNTILRKTDLGKFMRDVEELNHRTKRTRKMEVTFESVETIFDDTLELQVDMGSRFTHGLTLEFFQVFLSKASQLYGWTLVNLLVSLLNFFEPG